MFNKTTRKDSCGSGGIAGASLTNSIGTNMYTGGQTDISISLGVTSYNFSSGNWGYLGKQDNTVFQNIGFTLGGIVNAVDLYRYWTWDVLNREDQIAKLQKLYPEKKIIYDKTLTAEGYFDSKTNILYMGKHGLNKGLGWAKSTIEHETQHLADKFLATNEDWKEIRAYTKELRLAAKNGLTYKQFYEIEYRLNHYLKAVGITNYDLPSYNFKLWILSIVKR